MRRALWIGLATAAVLCVMSAPASAQVILRFDAPFPFVVEGKTVPAGMYEVIRQSPAVLELRAASGAPQALVLVTRLAAREGSAGQDEAVFDKVGNQNILSEIWLQGEDGYLIAATKGPHTHARVKGKK